MKIPLKQMRLKIWRTLGMIMFFLGIIGVPTAFAVVGHAEKFDTYTQEEIEEFHQNLATEERESIRVGKRTLATALKELRLLKERTAGSEDAELEKMRQEMVEEIRKEFGTSPDIDRFQFSTKFDYQFDRNDERARKESDWNSESVFDLDFEALVNLSGKKTDLRYVASYGRVWHWEESESDFYDVGQSIRYRRDYRKKLKHSLQLDVNRNTSKTIEIDTRTDKIRYDFSHSNSLNYRLSKKFSANLAFSGAKRLFTNEAFDQDSQWDVLARPSFFWHITPKSRMTFNYRFGASRIRSKAGDTNAHEFQLGYFGRVTKKSSITFVAGYERQTPRSNESQTGKTWRTSLSYIYQLTPKTTINTQILRAVQNTTSNSAGDSTDENATVKTDSHFTDNAIRISVNSRLKRNLLVTAGFGLSYLSTSTFRDGDQSSETSEWNLPFTVSATYSFTKWLKMQVDYLLRYRRGKSNVNSFRNHTLGMKWQVVF